MKVEKFDRKRGRHRKAASLETRDWNAKHLPAALKAPSWMDAETAEKLADLRRELDPWEPTP
jgi:hypothetical protein